MDDITPSLLKVIQKDFQSKFDKSDIISKLYAKVRDGTATYVEANEFAIEVGDILASAFKNNLSSAVLPDGKMYYNIAQRIITPTMTNNYELITDITNQVQKSLNKSANIGIKAVTPELNQDRIDGIINKVSNADNYDDVAWVLDEPIKNFSQSIVDDSIRANAEFHAKAGMKPVIVRRVAGDCCDWCKELAGTYSYPDKVPKDVYRRHQRCRCTVDYHPGNGKKQDVWSKRISDVKTVKDTSDYMGKPKVHQINLAGKEYAIKTYKNDAYENIWCQSYTQNSQKMCEYLNKEINETGKYGRIDQIVIAKNKTLQGIAAYDHQTNSLFISEELIDEKKFSEIVDKNFFAANNINDILVHELRGHKAHWESVERYCKNNLCKSSNTAKRELEVNLREYIIRQTNTDLFYLKKVVSENAFAQFKYENVLNECIADATILIKRGELRDVYLEELIEGVINYDDSAK